MYSREQSKSWVELNCFVSSNREIISEILVAIYVYPYMIPLKLSQFAVW